jgi:hypothetical protein
VESTIVENAKVMAKGQITLSKDVQARIGVGIDKVALICEGDKVILMNAAVYAMRALQRGMDGEWEKAGIYSDDDVMDIVKEVQAEMGTAKQHKTSKERLKEFYGADFDKKQIPQKEMDWGTPVGDEI